MKSLSGLNAVDFSELQQLGKVSRERTEDVTKRRLASVVPPMPQVDEDAVAHFPHATLIGEGGHQHSCKVVLTKTAVRVWGNEGSSYGSNHQQRSVPLHAVVRMVPSGPSVHLWHRMLPPLHITFMSSDKADRFCASFTELASASSSSQPMAPSSRLHVPETLLSAATAIAQLSSSVHEGQTLSAEFLTCLSKTQWLEVIATTLKDAVLRAQELRESRGEQRSLLVESVAKVVAMGTHRTARSMVDMLREWQQEGLHVKGSVARLMVLGSDVRERPRVLSAVPMLSLMWCFMDCMYQLVDQFPARFDFGEDLLRMVVSELESEGGFSDDWLNLLANCGSERTVEEDEDASMIEPKCDVWSLRLWRWMFVPWVVNSAPAAERSQDREIQQLRQTVSKLMVQISAQEAALKAMQQVAFQHEEKKEEEEEEQPIVEEEKPVLRAKDLSVSASLSIATAKEKETPKPSPTPPQEPFRVRGDAPKSPVLDLSDLLRREKKPSPLVQEVPEAPEPKSPVVTETPAFRVRGEAPPPAKSSMDIMESLRQSLSLREERLEAVSDATSQMQTNSKTLLEMAKELNAQAQAKQRRWGLF